MPTSKVTSTYCGDNAFHTVSKAQVAKQLLSRSVVNYQSLDQRAHWSDLAPGLLRQACFNSAHLPALSDYLYAWLVGQEDYLL